jgi:hypothetical protein
VPTGFVKQQLPHASGTQAGTSEALRDGNRKFGELPHTLACYVMLSRICQLSDLRRTLNCLVRRVMSSWARPDEPQVTPYRQVQI